METSTTLNSKPEKLDFAKILPVFIIVLIDLLGLTIIIPLLPMYAASFGINAALIGVLGAVYPIAQFVGTPFLGRLSDRYGRRPILLISQLGTFLGFILLGTANSIWILFLSRLIDGLSGANISTAQAVISDSTTPSTRTQGLGLIGAAFGIGFVFGPVIAFVSLLLGKNDFHVPALVAAGFSFLSILATFFLLKETHTPGESTKTELFNYRSLFTTLKKPLVGFLLILLFFQQIAFGGFEQLLSLFTLNRLGMDASGNAVLFVFIGILVVLMQGYFIGKLSRKFGDHWLIRTGLIILALGMIVSSLTPAKPVPWYNRATVEQALSNGRQLPGEIPATHHLQIALPDDTNRGYLGLAWLLIAMLPVAFGGSVLQPAINSLLTRSVGLQEVGGTLGISAAVISGANAIAPLAGGVLFQGLGAVYPFLLGGVILLVLWFWTKKELAA